MKNRIEEAGAPIYALVSGHIALSSWASIKNHSLAGARNPSHHIMSEVASITVPRNGDFVLEGARIVI